MVEPRRRKPLRSPALLIGLSLTLGPALAPATIEEQRSRLPPPAFECDDDPIVGVWRAHVHYAHVDQWYVFDLNIERAPEGGTALRGSIRAEFWSGHADRSQPPLCDEPGDRAAVLEQAEGRADGLALVFEGVDWRDLSICGPFAGSYLLDRFSGTVELERMEFQSLLNADAPQWRDVPTVFRRVRCGAGRAEPIPKIIVEPPPYQPPEREGCGVRDS
ncbi:MAG TPA: hypothetical protein VK034_26465 [Enhygromyxa sp.]|nr:hypothetical protein [Enhygromyxa sp.]